MDILGGGSFGTVWWAKTADGQIVAIKIQEREFGEIEASFLEELKGTPGVIQMIAAETISGTSYIVLPYANGGSLLDWIKAKHTLEEKMNMFIALCDCLLSLHGKGIIHCDLKPENILIIDDKPYIADFGMSYHDDGEFDGKAKVCTRYYRAPEMCLNNKGERSICFASDWWALGCIIFEMMTGDYFHCPECEAHILSLDEKGIEARAEKAGPEMAPIIKLCLKLNPENRGFGNKK